MFSSGRATRALPFLLVIAAAAWLWTLTPEIAAQGRPGRAGPELWPRMVLALMLGAAVWGAAKALFGTADAEGTSVLIQQAAKTAGREDDTARELEAESGDAAARRPLMALGGIAALLAFVALIPYVGFSVATFCLMTAVMLFAGYRRPLMAMAISAAGTLAFFFVFQRIAYLSLPLGVGPFRSLSTLLMSLMGVR